MNVKAGEHRRSELCGLDVTISARYDWPVACLFHYVIGISGILPYNRNVTLQTFFRSLEIFTACTVLTHGSIMLPPYEAVFISKLTCQLSSFFVQNFVQTTSTLCKQRQLCAKNDDHFVQTTTTLQGQRPLCTNNDDFARTTTTLYKQRRLCTNNDDFARTTTTLSKVHV